MCECPSPLPAEASTAPRPGVVVVCRHYFSKAFGGCRATRHRVRVLSELGYAPLVVHGDPYDEEVDGFLDAPEVEFVRSEPLFDLSLRRYLSAVRWGAHRRARRMLATLIRQRRPVAVLLIGTRPLRFYLKLQRIAPTALYREDSAAAGKPWRDLWGDYWLAGETPLRKAALIVRRRWEARRLRRFRLLVLNSQYLARIHGVPHALVQPPPLVGVDPASPTLEHSQRQRGLLVFAGRIEQAKGPHDAVRILAQLPEHFSLSMCGEGPMLEHCRALARRLGCADRIDFRGWMPPSAVLRAMRRAWVTLVPSRVDEAFSLVAIESLACGTPVVGYDSGGIAELACDGAGVVVPPSDTAAAARAVLEICESPPRWTIHSNAAFRRAEAYGPGQFRESMMDLMARLTGGESNGRP